MRLIDSAACTGCDAVKFQTYITENRAPKGNQQIFDILKRCELPFDAFEKLKNHAEQHGLSFFSTPFDRESVDYLEGIGCEIHKVASFDVVNKELLDAVSKSGKTVIMSVGMANHEEISEAYKILSKNTNKIAVLHCISAYPTKIEDAKLESILSLRVQYKDCVIGQSDHTDGIKVPLYAVAMGAQIIEKHYRVNNSMDCVDAPVSINEDQMRSMVSEIRELEQIIGFSKDGIIEPEQGAKPFRRFS